jgi:hypothetical protein
MTTPRGEHTATLLADGTVLIAGGFALPWGESPLVWSSAELYDSRTGTFRPTGNMTTPRSGHTATLLPDGRVLIAGGSDPASAQVGKTSAELYDPATRTFTATGAMTMGRSGHTATLLNSGRVLIVGGSAESKDSALTSAELYDPSTETFSPTGNLLEPAESLRATSLANGKVLISGWLYDDNVWPIHEIYDPSAGTFSLTGNQSGYWESAATLLMNGNVLVTYRYGSIVAVDGVVRRVIGTADLYDPASETFTATENVTTDYRIGHTATLLSDGKVLLAGGCGCETGANLFSADAYIYDPARGSFGNTGSMHANRWGHTATLLNDGRVLIAGGSTFLGTITPDGAAAGLTDTVSRAEVYTPEVLASPPALLSLSGDGKGQGAILHAGTRQVASSDNPASLGEPLEIYLTGLTDGGVIPPQVAIGGRMAELLYFGKVPGFDRLNQVNVRVPSGVAPGPNVSVRLTYLSRSSNEVTIAVQ